MFKVVPDQLKISDGWVRCGHCSDVFDATLYLDEWADGDAPSALGDDASVGPARHAPSSGRPEPQAKQREPKSSETLRPVGRSGPPQAVDVAPAQVVEPPPWPFDDDSPGEQLSGFTPLQDLTVTEPLPLPDRVSDALTRALTSPVQEGSPPLPLRFAPASAPAPVADPADETGLRARRGLTEDFRAELLQFASSTGAADMAATGPVDVPIGLPLHAEGPEEESPMGITAEAVETPAALGIDVGVNEPVPEFVQQARRKAFWRRPLVRGVLSLLVLLLAGGLLAQWAHHERHRLAAWHPQLEPLLRLMCEPPACEIGPLRRIDDIVIDSTALVRRLGNFYSFDIVLKNRSEVPLAVPALELTLTDIRDQTIARRVFLPAEWPGQPAALPARGSVAVSLRLAIELGDGTPMAGYRALVFYP